MCLGNQRVFPQCGGGCPLWEGQKSGAALQKQLEVKVWKPKMKNGESLESLVLGRVAHPPSFEWFGVTDVQLGGP